MARAFHYFSGLPLPNGLLDGNHGLGELSFIESERPGSSIT